MIGEMTMPANFKYKSVCLRGKPVHQKYDDFWRKHPPMPASSWAKIFAPFDALEGFDESIHSKTIAYCIKRELSETQVHEIDKTLARLRSLTYNGKAARQNRPQVTVTCFFPCSDLHSEWYGTGGRYKTIIGICRKVDDVFRAITVNDQTISLDDVSEISLL